MYFYCKITAKSVFSAFSLFFWMSQNYVNTATGKTTVTLLIYLYYFMADSLSCAHWVLFMYWTCEMYGHNGWSAINDL